MGRYLPYNYDRVHPRGATLRLKYFPDKPRADLTELRNELHSAECVDIGKKPDIYLAPDKMKQNYLMRNGPIKQKKPKFGLGVKVFVNNPYNRRESVAPLFIRRTPLHRPAKLICIMNSFSANCLYF